MALAAGVKVPLVYANILIRDWTSFQRLGISQIYGPTAYFSSIDLDFPVTLGEYRNPRAPTEPMVLDLQRVPCKPGLPKRSQNKVGRFELLATTFEMFEPRSGSNWDGGCRGEGSIRPATSKGSLSIAVARLRG